MSTASGLIADLGIIAEHLRGLVATYRDLASDLRETAEIARGWTEVYRRLGEIEP